MTKEERERKELYGTDYPCCGNCTHIRQAGYKLMCKLHREFRDFDSIKCLDYTYTKTIENLFDDNGNLQ